MTKITPEYVSNGMINVPNIKIVHKGYSIQAKLDMGSTPWSTKGNTIRRGYIVVKSGALAMPGGAWFGSVVEARAAIDILIKSDGNYDKFWTLMRANQGLSDYLDV
jgi:hypothetical protein